MLLLSRAYDGSSPRSTSWPSQQAGTRPSRWVGGEVVVGGTYVGEVEVGEVEMVVVVVRWVRWRWVVARVYRPTEGGERVCNSRTAV